MAAFKVNPDVLRWAREERRIAPADAATLIGITEDDLHLLETGGRVPNITELRKIASKYSITFAALLMPEPLPDSTRPQIKDFRTHESDRAVTDHDMMVELEDINQQLEALSDLMVGAPELFGTRNLQKLGLQDDVVASAARERAAFKITFQQQVDLKDGRALFLALRERIEARGVFVYARNLGPTRNCRGFSLLDNRDLPVIVVNSDEAEYGPRSFTLMHEYAHILLRETGISDENRRNRVEVFCNKFAAYFLMPPDEFRSAAKIIRPADGVWKETHVGRLANFFKVSKASAAIHMETLGLAHDGFYKALRAEWAKRQKPEKSGGFATHPEKLVNRFGARQVTLVLTAFDQGKINAIDAYELIGTKQEYMDAVRQEARTRQESYGGGG